ncbi:MAG: MerR family transcriptional regulator [Candidatus Obscuribacter sp.]|jgi:DNA-binding transcriptional MerR regulator|nr:MerR family transcriptional regulator [Candidatus Obscuribacter sp.]
MSRSKVEGTKIAQAAKDLNVTSVTIRRYIQEFNIETATDENGIKVLPKRALDELQVIRSLKEDGMTNPKVMEHLEDMRSKQGDEKEEKADKKVKAKVVKPAAKAKAKVQVVEEDEEDEVEEEEKPAPVVRKVRGRVLKVVKAEEEESEEEKESAPEVATEASGEKEEEEGEEDGEGKSGVMHTLTCQTCTKTFEHANPRLRDCLECYRTKRKERRRGGGEKHKNVIPNPTAQQVLSKSQGTVREGLEPVVARERNDRPGRDRTDRPVDRDRDRVSDRENGNGIEKERYAPVERERAPVAAALARPTEPSAWAQLQKPVRSYRKAIEETRLITGSLKRRLERPDLPEGERRWLEQVYAYQLILHQGWRHLAEYKSGSTGQHKPQED